jgi:WD40 repeat protein
VDDFVNWVKPALEGTTLFAGLGDVRSLHSSPDGRRLAVSGSSSTTVVLDLESGAALARLETGIYLTHLVLSKDGRVLAAAGESHLSLWDLETQRRMRAIEGRAPVALSADGAHLFYARANDDHLEIRRLPIASGKDKRLTRTKATMASLAVNPAGSELVLGTQQGLEVLDAENGKRVRSLSPEPSAIGSLSADGGRFARFSGGQVSVIDVASGRQLARFPVEGVGVEQMALSADGRWIGLAKSFSGFEVFDVDEGKSLMKVDDTFNGCYAVGIGPGKASFVTGWTDGSVRSLSVAVTEE